MAALPVVGLEIGTSKIVALVGEWRDDGIIMITGMGERASTGVRKGEVIDLANAAVVVRSVLSMAEERSNVSIGEVLLAVSGGHMQGLTNRGTVPVMSGDGKIARGDVDDAMDIAKAVNLPPEREILHTISQHFCIDNDHRVVNPEGLHGGHLSVDMLVIHGVRNRLNSIVQAARNVPVDVEDVAFSGLCSALSVLIPEQKKNGVVVIDLGGGKTDYLVYAGGVVAEAGVLAVGGDHVTNDISIGFGIPNAQAEMLKRETGSVDLRALVPAPTVTLPPEGSFTGRDVSVAALNQVMHARLDELLRMLKRRLENSDVLHQLGWGVVLTGGGAHLRGIVPLAESIFKLHCEVGRPRNVSGLTQASSGPEYATVCGLVQYGYMTRREPTRGGGTLKSWLTGLLPR